MREIAGGISQRRRLHDFLDLCADSWGNGALPDAPNLQLRSVLNHPESDDFEEVCESIRAS